MAFPRTSTLSEVQLAQELNPFDFIIIGSGMGGGTLARRLIQKGQRVLLIEKGGLEYSTHVLNTSRPHFDHESKDPSTPGRDNEEVFQQVRKPWAVKKGSTPNEIGGGAVNALEDELFPESIVDYLNGEGYQKALRLTANSPPSDALYPNNQIEMAADDSPDVLSVDDAKSRLKKALDDYGKKSGPSVLITNGAEFSTNDKLYYFPQGAYSTVDYLLDRLHAKDEKLTVLANYEVVSFATELATSPRNTFEIQKIILRSADNDSGAKEIVTQNPSTKKNTPVILCAGTVDSAAIALRSHLNKLPFETDGTGNSQSACQLPGSFIGKGLTDHEVWTTRFWNPDYDSMLPVELVTSKVPVNKHDSLLTICTQAERFYLHEFATGDEDDPTPKKGNTLNVLLEFETILDESSSVTIDPITSEPLLELQRKRLDESPHFHADLRSLAKHLYDNFDMPKGVEVPQPVLGNFGFIGHEVGTMRMGENPERSVVDENLKVHFMNNLFVCDLSVFPCSPMANPSLTLVALAIRLGDHLTKPHEDSK